MDLPKDISSCHALIKILVAQNQDLVKRLSDLEADYKQLQEEVAQLKARLNQNSRNSGRPPSSDGFSKKPAFARKKGGKRGGQKGHKGKTLEMVQHPDQVVEHSARQCSCGRCLADVEKRLLERRQVFDLPRPKLEVTEHQLQSCICPDCHTLQVGQFPAEVPARVQYGSGVRSLVVLLNNGYKLSFAKIRQFFSDVFGYQLNESTQIRANEKCYEALVPSEARIKQALLCSPVAHFDETGLRVAGKLHWLHNCSNQYYTYLFIHTNRGKKALSDQASLIPHYQGWAVHDCWASYFRYDNCRHSVCAAHLLRELQALIEQGSIWADRMRDLLLYAYTKSDEGQSSVPNFNFFDRHYDRICQMADREEPPPKYRYKNKRPKKSKGRNLMERLVQHKDAVLAFAKYTEVPFTNNQAERDVRPAKIKQKMAGCLRTFKGAQVYARIQSFISTARKQQLNVFNELVATFGGSNSLTAHKGC